MCHFFSFISDGKGTYYYADWALRKKLRKDPDARPDSHSWLAEHFVKNGAEDSFNKYEYDPLTKEFSVDQINTEDDHESAEKWCRELDFKRICEPLIIKKMRNPLAGRPKVLTSNDKKLVRKWASVRHSMGGSVGGSIYDSLTKYVGQSAGNSAWISVWQSVGVPVWDSIMDSAEWITWDHMRWSIRDSAMAYSTTFMDVRLKVDVSPSNKLWERGFVVSFNGDTYSVHSGKEAKIVWTYKPKR
jgi:hypothetical protein